MANKFSLFLYCHVCSFVLSNSHPFSSIISLGGCWKETVTDDFRPEIPWCALILVFYLRSVLSNIGLGINTDLHNSDFDLIYLVTNESDSLSSNALNYSLYWIFIWFYLRRLFASKHLSLKSHIYEYCHFLI